MLLFGPKRDENEEWRKLHNEECCYNNERPTEQKQQLLDGRTVENKNKLFLTEITFLEIIKFINIDIVEIAEDLL